MSKASSADLVLLTGSLQHLFLGGAVELVRACRAAGLKTAVGSSAEQVKVRALAVTLQTTAVHFKA
jgi:phosphoserine phosphatase